jgi:guanine deaminase
MIAGKVLQDRHSPDGVRDETEQSLVDTEALIRRWHGAAAWATPSRRASRRAAARRSCAAPASWPRSYPDVWIQSHVAENKDEIRWARELFPASRSYLSVYEDFGLMRERAIYAHCIHFDDEDRALMRDTGAAAAVSPTSNLFLGSGFFDYEGARASASATAWPATSAAAPASAPSTPCWRRTTWPRRPDQARHQPEPAEPVVAAHGRRGAGAGPGRRGRQPAPGCEADFLVLDPQGHAAAGAQDRRMRATSTNCCSR